MGKLDCFQIHWLRFSKLWKWFSKLAPDKPYQYGESRFLTADILLKRIEEDIWEFIFLCEVFWGWFWWSARHLHLNFCWPTVNMVIKFLAKPKGQVRNALGKPLLNKAAEHTAGGGWESVTVWAHYSAVYHLHMPVGQRFYLDLSGGQRVLTYPVTPFQGKVPSHTSGALTKHFLCLPVVTQKGSACKCDQLPNSSMVLTAFCSVLNLLLPVLTWQSYLRIPEKMLSVWEFVFASISQETGMIHFLTGWPGEEYLSLPSVRTEWKEMSQRKEGRDCALGWKLGHSPASIEFNSHHRGQGNPLCRSEDPGFSSWSLLESGDGSQEDW